LPCPLCVKSGHPVHLQILVEGLESAASGGKLPDRRLALLFAVAHPAVDPARPQWSGIRGHTAAATQASHSSNVISNLETANGFAIVTSCGGPSLALRSKAFSGDPIVRTWAMQKQMFAKGKIACYRCFAFNRNRSIISFAGCVGSSRRLACSAPATGSNAGSSNPTCTRSDA
jgi:hypothetical protein